MSQDRINFCHDDATRVVRKVLLRKTKDWQLIEDICQEVWIRCSRKWEQGHEPLPVHWERVVVRAAQNRLHSDWRRLSLSRKHWRRLGERIKASGEEDLARAKEKCDRWVVLLSLLDGLPSRYREITRLKILEGLSCRQIAEEKGLKVDTVKSQLRRAKIRLAPAVKRRLGN